MAGPETRLLLLGAVAIFHPVNGYQIRRELMSWQVDQWANVQPGSIYHGLRSLAARGDLVQHELDDGGRTVSVYEPTEQGLLALQEMMRVAITELRPVDRLAFNTAVSLLPLLDRPQAREYLDLRRSRIESSLHEWWQVQQVLPAGTMPPHVDAVKDLWTATAEAERDWLARTVRRIDDGELSFRGESPGWTPAPDDPGWQMQGERERYLQLLARRP